MDVNTTNLNETDDMEVSDNNSGNVTGNPDGNVTGNTSGIPQTNGLPNIDNIIFDETEKVIQFAKQFQLPPSDAFARDIEGMLLDYIRKRMAICNTYLEKGCKMKPPHYCAGVSLANLVIKLEYVRRLKYAEEADNRQYKLGIYQFEGVNKGIYDTDETAIRKAIRKYHYSITERGMRDVLETLKDMAPIEVVGKEKHLIAVNNGIFDYDKKVLLDFSPEYIFVSKCRVDFIHCPAKVTIHRNEDNTDWDVDSWVHELTDDPQVEKLLWQIIGAVIRPKVRWDKAIFLYSTVGNNGKGTFCTLLRNICGAGNYASIAIDDMSKEFRLTPLLHVSAVIVDENNVSGYLDNASVFKAMVTGDSFQINKKHKDPVDFRFSGLMVQCVNFLPRVNDKTSSLYRRLLMVPFDKCFTGRERKYIKSDYLNRKDVLEYVLHKVLMDMPSYYEFDVPDVSEELLGEYKTFNDPVRQFAEELLPELKWDLVPYRFLYDLFKEWYKENVPSGKIQGKNTFLRELKDILDGCVEWKVTGSSVPTQGYSFGYEPLIARYNLTNWMNTQYFGSDQMQKCTPSADVIKSSASGILRVAGYTVVEEDAEKPFTEEEK